MVLLIKLLSEGIKRYLWAIALDHMILNGIVCDFGCTMEAYQI